MSTATSPTLLRARRQGAPAGRVLIGLAVAFALLFVGLLLGGGGEQATDVPGDRIIADYDGTYAAVHVSGYAGVVAAVVLVFLGAGLRQALRRGQSSWTADVAFAGTIAMAMALVGFVVTGFAMYSAVDSGTPEVAQAINVLDHAGFVPAMLGLACTMIGAGLAALRSGALPKWLAMASVAIGGLAPLGPGGFVPFTLFPVWLVVVAVLASRRAPADLPAQAQAGLEEAARLQ